MSGEEYDSEAGRTNEEGTSDGGSRRESAAGSSSPPNGSPQKEDGASRKGGGSGAGASGGTEAVAGEKERKDGAHVSASDKQQTPSRPRQEHEKKKVRSGKQPRPRKSMFRIRFRKAHDTYTAEELGATPRRLRRLTLSGVYVQNLKEHDIQAYFVIEASPPPGQPALEPLLQSDVVRGDKTHHEVAWSKQATMDLEDEMLFADQRLCFSVYQKRQLWSTRVIGYAFVSLRDAFARPGVLMQDTYKLFKEKDEAERRSRDKMNADASASSHRDTNASDTGSVTSTTSSTPSTVPRTWSGGNLFRRASKDTDDEDAGSKVRGHVTMTWLVEDSVKLPFCLSVPPLHAGQCHYDIIDHLGIVVAKLEYLGRSKCAWCTNVDPSAAFYSDYTDADAGPQEEACCNACSLKGWSECVVMWDKKGTAHTSYTRAHTHTFLKPQRELC